MNPVLKRERSPLALIRSAAYPVWTIVLFMSALLFSGQACASLNINSVTLNGGSSTTVASGATISVVVSETNTGRSNWQSTSVTTTNTTTNAQVTACVNTTNYSGNGTYNATFNITAPAVIGTYNVDVFASSNGTCTGAISGTFTLAGGIIVVAAPTVTGISPTSGPTAGGTAVTITGTNFTGATSVTIGGVAATGVTVVNATTITATTPAGTAGAKNVLVTAPGGTGTGSNLFTYVAAPTVTGISPGSGPTAGGTAVTITGTNFTGATSVTIGGVAATGMTVSNATTIMATTPAGTAGAKDVVVTTIGGAGTGTGLYTYVAAPTVTTNSATALTSSGATLNGTVSSNGASTAVTFDYGLDNTYGSSATATASPLAAGATNTAVSAAITGLICNTTYHFRVKGVNSTGTTNGNDLTFSTSVCPPPVVVLSKVASTSAAAIGSYVTFNITATNPTASPLNNVVVTDAIPAGMSYSNYAATLGTATVSGQTLSWNIPSIPAGSGAQLTLVVQLTISGTFTNTVSSPGATDASASILVLSSAITHYRMDEAAGSWNGSPGEVIDSGGNALNGHRRTTSTPTNTNTVVPVPTIPSQHSSVVGDFCNAGNFDGTAVVESAGSPFFQFTNKLSASAWIYPTAYPGGDLYSILSNDVNYEFHLNPAGNLYWWWNNGVTLTSAGTIPLNQWTHIAITMDGSLGASSREPIYINGVQDPNTNNWGGTLQTNTCPFYIGGDISTGSNCSLIPGRNFHGMIDEAKIYNYELSAAEVQADMNLGRLCGATTFDHIQIEHDGTASTCTPKVVTVKACMDATCSSLYPGTVTVKLSPTGWIPGDVLTISGGVASATLSNTSITPPSITLGTLSVSPTAANATSCYNGSTASCTLSVAANATCLFDAVETNANPHTHLYTKLAGTPFNVDVLALSNPTTVNTTYTGTVTVDLVDTSSVACSPSSTVLSTGPTITYVAASKGVVASKGRIPVSLTCPTAAPNVQVRMTTGASFACSYDKFAVRPSAVTLITNASAAAPGASASPAIQAGMPFNIGATTTPVGYAGVLTLDSTKLTAQLPSDVSAQINGGIVGLLTLNSSLLANTAQSGNATYNEVGYLYANAGAFRDSTFTSVDQNNQIDGCTTTNPESCDCLLSVNTTNPGVPDNLSDVLINGRYGCYVGNKTTVSFGRFIPEHFNTAITPVAGVPMPCPTNLPVGMVCPIQFNGFVYSGQAFTTQVSARNLTDGSTQNYYGYFAKSVTLSAAVAPGGATTASGSMTNNTIATATFIAGAATTNTPIFTFASAATAPTNIYIRATDAEGVTSQRAINPTATSIEGGVMVVSGRVKVSNAYGSELLPLTLMATAQYYTATGWLNSNTDSITQLVLNYGGTISTSATLSPANRILSLGNLSIILGAPNATGVVTATPTIDPTSPGNPPFSSGSGTIIPGKATFGIYKNNNGFIYRRENY
jgi:hypothetical protein